MNIFASRDDGAASVEWVGVIVLAALVVGTVGAWASTNNPAVRNGLAKGICTLTSGSGGVGCGDSQAAPVSASPAAACTAGPGTAPADQPVTRASLNSGGDVWQKTLGAAGSYRVSLSQAPPADDGSAGEPTSVVLDAAATPVAVTREAGGAMSLTPSRSWLAPSSAEADRLVAQSLADGVGSGAFGDSPVRGLWDGVHGLDGADGPGADVVIGSGVVMRAADEALGVSSYPASQLGTTTALGVRVSADQRSTVFLGSSDGAVDVVSAVTVDSTGALRLAEVTVLPGLAAQSLDQRVLAAFDWDSSDGSATPEAFSASVDLGESAPTEAFGAASALLSSAGSTPWSHSATTGSAAASGGSPLGSLGGVDAFVSAARTSGTVSAVAPAEEQTLSRVQLDPAGGGVGTTWDTAARGLGGRSHHDGQGWSRSGPCG